MIPNSLGGSSSYPPFPDPSIEPALKVIREHRDIAKEQIKLLEEELEDVQLRMESDRETLSTLTKQRDQFTHELRAHERVLQQLTVQRFAAYTIT